MKQWVILLLCIVPCLANAGGQSESGRASTQSLVGSSTYVASSYIDTGSVIDDYFFPYHGDDTKSLTFFVKPSNPYVFELGGSSDVEVSFTTNSYDSYDDQDFDYVIFVGDPNLLTDAGMLSSLSVSLRRIVPLKTPRSNIYLYLRNTKQLLPVTSASGIGSQLELLKNEVSSSEGKTLSDYFRRAKRDLEAVMVAARSLAHSNPAKFFWIMDKPIAVSRRDIDDVFSIVAGLRTTGTEVSFCGHNVAFRAATVNELVRAFGGNSYYFSDPKDLADVVVKDYKFYKRPAVLDLEIDVRNLGPATDDKQETTFKLKSMGADEHHTYLMSFKVPARASLSLTGYAPRDDPSYLDRPHAEYLSAAVLIRYYDCRTAKYHYEAHLVSQHYTSDYALYCSSFDKYAVRNREIANTYGLISGISVLLQRGDTKTSLVRINEQIERLQQVSSLLDDPMISEDIALLQRYRGVIYENRGNPFNGLKALSQLTFRRY